MADQGLGHLHNLKPFTQPQLCAVGSQQFFDGHATSFSDSCIKSYSGADPFEKLVANKPQAVVDVTSVYDSLLSTNMTTATRAHPRLGGILAPNYQNEPTVSEKKGIEQFNEPARAVGTPIPNTETGAHVPDNILKPPQLAPFSSNAHCTDSVLKQMYRDTTKMPTRTRPSNYVKQSFSEKSIAVKAESSEGPCIDLAALSRSCTQSPTPFSRAFMSIESQQGSITHRHNFKHTSHLDTIPVELHISQTQQTNEGDDFSSMLQKGVDNLRQLQLEKDQLVSNRVTSYIRKTYLIILRNAQMKDCEYSWISL